MIRLREQSLKVLLLPLVIWGCSGTGFVEGVDRVVKNPDGVVVHFDNGTKGFDWIRLSVVDDGIIRVLSGKGTSPDRRYESLIRESHSFHGEWELKSSRGELRVLTSRLVAQMDLSSLEVHFFDKQEKSLLKESGRTFESISVAGEAVFEITQHFDWSHDGALYGLGQHQDGELNRKGRTVKLRQENTEIAIPVLLSTEGYGILWDNYSETTFKDEEDSSFLRSKVADEIDYYFMIGPEFDDIISSYRQLTGAASMIPKWALGFIQSRCRYPSFDELMSVARRYRAMEVPLDVMMISYRHWGKYGMGSLEFDEDWFPDPEKYLTELEMMNVHAMISTWPSFEPKTTNHQKMAEGDYLLGFQNYFKAEVYDAYNPEAGKLYWKMLQEQMFDKGIDGWWLDCTEPEYPNLFREARTHLGSGERYLNTFSLLGSKNIYEGQRNYDPSRRPFILTRSSFAGQQRYGAASWSGDVGKGLKLEVGSDFETLKAQIPAGLNFCMSGVPYWTTDIGGYKGGLPSNPEFQEVYLRWFQYGAFCPIFRTHGERYPGVVASPRNNDINGNEIWSYGEEVMKICADFIKLRYRLMPYIYSEASEVSFEASTIMRSLAFEFRDDPNVYNIKDQFMFGNSFLVCPVTEAQADFRSVYLPRGTDWIDFWTGRTLEGGQTQEYPAPRERIPIFVRAGSIVPMGPVVQYANESFNEPIELRVYPGKNTEFQLYSDKGEGHGFENGEFSRINVAWDNARSEVKFSAREGSYEGMAVEQQFRLVMVNGSAGNGIYRDGAGKVITYSGEELTLSL